MYRASQILVFARFIGYFLCIIPVQLYNIICLLSRRLGKIAHVIITMIRLFAAWSTLNANVYTYDTLDRMLIVELITFKQISWVKSREQRRWPHELDNVYLNMFQGRPRNCVNLFIVHSLSPTNLRLWFIHARHHWYVQLTLSLWESWIFLICVKKTFNFVYKVYH